MEGGLAESRLKENATAVKKLFGTAAKLAQKQAALATLNNVTLPKIYHAIGKKIVGLDKLPPDLMSHREKIQALEARIAARPEESTTAPAEGFAAKAKHLAQQAAQKASKASADAAATMQIHAAYVSLGKAAVEKYGAKSVPTEILPELQGAQGTIKQLKDEIATLSVSSRHGLLTPSRLLLVGGISTAVVLSVVLFRSFRRDESRLDGGVNAQDVAASRDMDRSASKAPSLADATRANTDATLSDPEKSGAVTRFKSQAQRELSQWQDGAEKLKESLLRDPALSAGKRDEAPDAWSDLAARKDQELEDAYRDMWERLRSDLEKRSGDEQALASASAQDLSASLAAFAAACAKERAQLTQLREKAIADIAKFRSELATKKASAIAQLVKLVEAEKTRWEKATKTCREPLVNDAGVKSLQKPFDAEGWARLAKQEQSELTRTVQQQQETVNRELDRIREESERQLRDTRTESDAAAALGAAQERAAQLVSESLSRMNAQRQNGIKVLGDFIAMEQHKKAEDMQNAVLAGRAFTGKAGLTDDALRRVLAEAPNVTDLFLRECASLTDACIPDIAKLRDLRKLELPAQCGITPEGLRPLQGKKITFLELPKSVFDTKEGFQIFVSMVADPALASPNHSLSRASDVKSGGEWDLYHLRIGDDALSALRGLRKLDRLGMPKDATDAGLATVSAIPDLELLCVTLSPQITDKGIAALAKCRKLRQLILMDSREVPQQHNQSGSSVGATGLRALKGLGLEELDLPQYMHVEECFAPFLDSLRESKTARHGKSLRWIRLSGLRQEDDWPFTKTAVKAMAGKRGIRELVIEACTCDDEALVGLGDIPDLEKLVLTNVSGFQGTGLRGLGRAKNLKFVTVSGCGNFGDEGVRCLAECGNLHTVDISGAPNVSDDGLTAIAACKTIRLLRIRGTAATPAIEVKLENAIPKLDVGFEE